MVIGYSGAGKSTLARALAGSRCAPVLHLDRLYWLPGWHERDPEQMRGMLDAFLKEHDSWVIDGTYSRFLFEQRLEAADEIVILALPRLVCLARAWRRYRRHRGHAREDMAPGCPERFDRAFIRLFCFNVFSAGSSVFFRSVGGWFSPVSSSCSQ